MGSESHSPFQMQHRTTQINLPRIGYARPKRSLWHGLVIELFPLNDGGRLVQSLLFILMLNLTLLYLATAILRSLAASPFGSYRYLAPRDDKPVCPSSDNNSQRLLMPTKSDSGGFITCSYSDGDDNACIYAPVCFLLSFLTTSPPLISAKQDGEFISGPSSCPVLIRPPLPFTPSPPQPPPICPPTNGHPETKLTRQAGGTQPGLFLTCIWTRDPGRTFGGFGFQTDVCTYSPPVRSPISLICLG
jgi:hypothetical protein